MDAKTGGGETALIEAGASLNEVTNRGHFAAEEAMIAGDLDCLLLEAWCDLSMGRWAGCTLAMFADKEGLAGALALLIEFGADVDAQDGSGWSAAMR